MTEVLIDGVRYVPETEVKDVPPLVPPSFRWSQRSLNRMKGVHEDLVRVLNRAISISPVDMIVLEGLRTKERQRQLVAQGKSWTMRSRHLTGHAVDVAPYFDQDKDGDIDGDDLWHWPSYHKIAEVIKKAAALEGVQIEWGGDWKEQQDGPHWQLPWDIYPA